MFCIFLIVKKVNLTNPITKKLVLHIFLFLSQVSVHLKNITKIHLFPRLATDIYIYQSHKGNLCFPHTHFPDKNLNIFSNIMYT